MESALADNHTDKSEEVKTVKCSMCRKVKTCDHFFNPNSDTLFHVCDYCRYLRKTKYKKRRVRVELERPASTISRNRDSTVPKTTKILQPNTSGTESNTPSPKKPEVSTDQSHPWSMGVIPSQKCVDIPQVVSNTPTPSIPSGQFHCDSRYAVNHPYYRYQNVLCSMCAPPQVVCDEKNQVVVLRSCIPPAPQSLIFCCNAAMNGNYFSVYDRRWVTKDN